MRKKGLLTFAIILVLMMVAACSSGNNNNGETEMNTDPVTSNNNEPNNTSEEDTADVEPEKGPPAELSMMVQSAGSWPLNPDWLVYDLIEEYANVELDVTGYQGNWWEAIPLIIASGDMPDLMWMSGTDIIHKHGSEGALENLLDHLDIMPNLKAWMEEYPTEANGLLSHDGKLYMSPANGAYGDYDGLWLYREDIFTKNNLTVPKTYDEMYETLLELKKIYPESYPLYVSGWGQLNTISLSFGSANNFYYNEEAKEWRYGPSEDNYSEAVEFLANAYKDKLIPQEFGNMNNNKKNELITTNKTFIMFGYINQIDAFNNLGRPLDPDFNVTQFTPPGGAGHEGVHGRTFIFREGLTVTTTSENKEAALKYVDAQFTEEARELVSWGKEGVTYEVVDGKNQYLPVVKDSNTRSNEFGIRTAGISNWFDNEANIQLFNEETKEAYMEAANYYAPAARTVAFTDDEKDSISLKEQAIGKYVSENVSKFILGQQQMSEWDTFVQGLVDLGMNDVLEVYEQAFARTQ